MYAGVLNDKDFGGVFVTHNGGTNWSQFSDGLADRDVFTMLQTSSGALLAGTNRGILKFDVAARQWRSASTVLTEKTFPTPKPRKVKGKLVTAKAPKPLITKSELTARVTQFQAAGDKLFASTTNGLYISSDDGKAWTGGAVSGQTHFLGVSVFGSNVALASPTGVLLSADSGQTWTVAEVPNYVRRIYHVLIVPDQSLWLTSREGALHSTDGGKHWDHVMGGLPPRDVFNIEIDAAGNRLLATVAGSGNVYESRTQGRTWKIATLTDFALRQAINYNGHLLAATVYNGLIMQRGDVNTAAVRKRRRAVRRTDLSALSDRFASV